MFGFSRAYVPISLYQLYRQGVFQESSSFGEIKYVVRVFIVMQLLNYAGHYAFRKYTQ